MHVCYLFSPVDLGSELLLPTVCCMISAVCLHTVWWISVVCLFLPACLVSVYILSIASFSVICCPSLCCLLCICFLSIFCLLSVYTMSTVCQLPVCSVLNLCNIIIKVHYSRYPTDHAFNIYSYSFVRNCKKTINAIHTLSKKKHAVRDSWDRLKLIYRQQPTIPPTNIHSIHIFLFLCAVLWNKYKCYIRILREKIFSR